MLMKIWRYYRKMSVFWRKIGKKTAKITFKNFEFIQRKDGLYESPTENSMNHSRAEL